MKNTQKKRASIKKLTLNKKSIVLFDTLKGGTEFNTIYSHQSLGEYTCAQDF
ncbi:hypothetical protein IMCC3317_27390 [Kordia antarctica]|uniref:Uncharacterized protein n=1 Tax=Kordia antarctica TaxID=1218801 RepID=A0A7L4ZLD6_9FLAO|nr:hypothetical protein [Kordia antarctica]QHI37360.1 hypothetical protein IMCC3317_27390 [Kordia antarctica]